MQLSTYLFFNGQCEAAFKFYERLLGGKIEGMMTHAGSPAEEQVPAEWRDKILHARMTVGDTAFMASDAPPGHYQKPQGFSVSLQLKDPVEGNVYLTHWRKTERCRCRFQKTFWSPGFRHVCRSIRHTLDG